MSFFDRCIGNDRAKEQLTVMARSKKIPQVLFFYGLEGVGKSLFADALIDEYFKASGIEDAAQRLEKKLHPDVMHIFPDPKTKIHQVEVIKELVASAEKAPYESAFRFYVIHHAEGLQKVHANRLLKTFEEAPDYNRFILLGSSLGAVIPTILSRAIRVHFVPLTKEELKNYIVNHYEMDEKDTDRLAMLASGSLSQLKRVVNEDFIAMSQQVIELIKQKLTHQYSAFYNQLDQMGKNFEGDQLTLCFPILRFWIADLIRLSQTSSSEGLFFPEEKTNLLRCIPYISRSERKLFSHIQRAEEGLKAHIKPVKCLEYALLNLA